jgi:hypothetical protein
MSDIDIPVGQTRIILKLALRVADVKAYALVLVVVEHKVHRQAESDAVIQFNVISRLPRIRVYFRGLLLKGIDLKVGIKLVPGQQGYVCCHGR